MALNGVTAIILARGGSKGIPRKNIIDFCGKPLIAWTITQANQSGISDVYVSTDDDEIAAVAVKYGAEIIKRPPDLAADASSSDEGLVHAVSALALANDDVVTMPQITSPLRSPTHIRAVTELVLSGDFDSAFTANQMNDLCVWSVDESPRSVTYDFRSRQMRQERSSLVVENGSAYCTRVGALIQSSNRLSGRIGISLMPRWTLPEIDEAEDLKLCETLMATYVQEGSADISTWKSQEDARFPEDSFTEGDA